MTTNKTSKIHLSIAFGDAILPIIDCEDGHQRVPLKPIVDQIGAQWEGQRRKVQPEKYLGQRLGTKTTTLKCGDTPLICIRLDRVTAFLNTINPENVRAMGNHDAADWLEAKHQEWDDALHQYETAGFAVNKSHYSTQEQKEKGYLRMVSVIREKNKRVAPISVSVIGGTKSKHASDYAALIGPTSLFIVTGGNIDVQIPLFKQLLKL